MGVKGFYTYLKAYRHDVYSGTLPEKPTLRIGFDAMSMLYKYKSSYEEIYPVLKDLLSRGHKLFFVFDGKPPVEKEAEVKERRDARTSATSQANSLREYLHTEIIPKSERDVLEYSLARLEFQGWHMSREIRHAFQKELWNMTIPYVKSISEADDVLSDMAAAGKLDVIVSTDMDFLLSGVARLWIPTRNYGFEEIILQEVLDGENLTPKMLLDTGILCGVEALRGKVSVSSHIAFSWMRYYKSIEAVLESAIQEAQILILKDAELLAQVRQHFTPRLDWKERIRPDHLERCKEFIENL